MYKRLLLGPSVIAVFVMFIVDRPFAASLAQAAPVACGTVAACLFGTNDASGPGVEGSSVSGFGLEGRSKRNDGVVGVTAVNAPTASAGKAGVSGYDAATNHNRFNSGVYGVSDYSNGVQGRSTHGNGVLALALATGTALSAVAGPTAMYAGFTNTGVVAQSASGDGIIGIGNSTGVVGFAANNCLSQDEPVACTQPLQNEIPSGAAVTAGTDYGGLGLSIRTEANPFLLPNDQPGVGETIDAGTVGLMITNDRASEGVFPALIISGNVNPRETAVGFQGAVISGYNGLSVTGTNDGIAATGTTAFIAQSAGTGSVLFQGAASNGTTVAQLNDSGNLTIAGSLTQKGTLITILRGVDGGDRAAYSAHSTSPMVDDVGESALVAGSGFVAIDSALAASIDVTRGYLVFLTAQGATPGLYVSNKTRAGFTVREIGGARDSIPFDYRIVARPYGDTGRRLALMPASIRSATTAAPLFYRHLKPLRFLGGKLDRSSLPKPSL